MNFVSTSLSIGSGYSARYFNRTRVLSVCRSIRIQNRAVLVAGGISKSSNLITRSIRCRSTTLVGIHWCWILTCRIALFGGLFSRGSSSSPTMQCAFTKSSTDFALIAICGSTTFSTRLILPMKSYMERISLSLGFGGINPRASWELSRGKGIFGR